MDNHNFGALSGDALMAQLLGPIFGSSHCYTEAVQSLLSGKSDRRCEPNCLDSTISYLYDLDESLALNRDKDIKELQILVEASNELSPFVSKEIK